MTCFKSAERDRAGFVARDGLLFIIAQRHRANHFLQLGLVVPFPWREHITGSAVALHCCKAHAKINRKMGNLTPCEIVTPKNITLKLHT